MAAGTTSGGPSIETAGQHPRARAAVHGAAERRNDGHHHDEQLADQEHQAGDAAGREEVWPKRIVISEKSTTITARAVRSLSSPQSSERPAERRPLNGGRCAAWEVAFMLRLPGIGFFEEVTAARHVEQLARDRHVALLVAADIHHLADGRADGRRASELARVVVAAFEVFHQHRVERQPRFLAVQLENPAYSSNVGFFARIL